jgi:hypothetical protein
MSVKAEAESVADKALIRDYPLCKKAAILLIESK